MRQGRIETHAKWLVTLLATASQWVVKRKHSKCFNRRICLAIQDFYRWALWLRGWSRPWERGRGEQGDLLSPSSSVSHWSKFAPWELVHHTSGLFHPALWEVTEDAKYHRQCCEISFKSKSDERSQKLLVVASKPECTAATTDSDSMCHCQTIDSMVWKISTLKESEAGQRSVSDILWISHTNSLKLEPLTKTY